MTTSIAEKPQPLQALERAKEIKTHVAQSLLDLSHNRRSLESALHDEMLATVQISALLMALPSRRVAPSTRSHRSFRTSRKILMICGLNPVRRVESLTDTSREALLCAAEEVSGCVAWIRQERRAIKLAPAWSNPAQNDEQRTAALTKANQVRTARKEAKEAMRNGEMDLAAALEHEALRTYRIGHLVRNLRRVTPDGTKYLNRLAPAAAMKVLKDNRISPLVTPDELSADGKRLLVMLFADQRFRQPDPMTVAS